MSNLPRDLLRTKANKIGTIIDHLVAALGSDPGCPLRRAVILADIDENPSTTQTDIIARLGADKASLARDIEWLYDYGCIMRSSGEDDARVTHLFSCGYAKKNLEHAVQLCDSSHKSLKNLLLDIIHLFGDHKPTLRDAKIIAVVCDYGSKEKQDVLANLYNGPSSTDNRAIRNLIDNGLIYVADDNTKEDQNAA